MNHTTFANKLTAIVSTVFKRTFLLFSNHGGSPLSLFGDQVPLATDVGQAACARHRRRGLVGPFPELPAEPDDLASEVPCGC